MALRAETKKCKMFPLKKGQSFVNPESGRCPIERCSRSLASKMIAPVEIRTHKNNHLDANSKGVCDLSANNYERDALESFPLAKEEEDGFISCQNQQFVECASKSGNNGRLSAAEALFS